ncbi:hypothetical protein [Sphingopyxis sp.]|uniref:hypothetical protein n=1 Tax=Sphingopyxis sp. TaxID=1908224 RepID=UPI0035ADAE12
MFMDGGATSFQNPKQTPAPRLRPLKATSPAMRNARAKVNSRKSQTVGFSRLAEGKRAGPGEKRDRGDVFSGPWINRPRRA